MGSPQGLAAAAVGVPGGWGRDDTNICLWWQRYAADPGPLSPGCGCYTCARHSRAYVHHLLQTGEMLAQVWLRRSATDMHPAAL